MKKLTFSELVDKHLSVIAPRKTEEEVSSEEITIARKAALAEMEKHG